MVVLALSASAFAQVSAKTAVVDPYQKWVDEDAAYIITPEERAQYSQLTSDKERNDFIVHFWLRRDPTPGTAENEFKEEHYRRIAYSNIHYPDSLAGWKTDRGRIYILNGPPDEIQNIGPSMATGPVDPAQIWTYRDGRQFRFVDSCDCGEYRLHLRP